MDIVTALLALTCGALVVYAFDRLGAMIPDSSWGGLYIAGRRPWTASPGRILSVADGRSVRRSSEFDGTRTTIEDSDDPVDGIADVTGAAPRWLY